MNIEMEMQLPMCSGGTLASDLRSSKLDTIVCKPNDLGGQTYAHSRSTSRRAPVKAWYQRLSSVVLYTMCCLCVFFDL